MARVFEPTGKYVSTTSAPRLNQTAGTVAFWVKPMWMWNDGVQHILGGFKGGTGYGFLVDKYSDNNLKAGWYPNTEKRVIVSASCLVRNRWHLIAITYSTSANRTDLYVDDANVGNSECTTFDTLNGTMSWGSYDGIDARSSIAHVMHWSRILTEGELTTLYENPQGGANSIDDLVFYYALAGADPETDSEGGPSLTVTGSPIAIGGPGDMVPVDPKFSAISIPSYFDPDPENLRDFEENFESDDGQFTVLSETGAPGTYSLASNQLTITHSGAKNTIIQENTSSFVMGQAFVQIQIDDLDPGGGSSDYDIFRIGLFKDANNFVCAEYNRDSTWHNGQIHAKIAGTDYYYDASFSFFPTSPPFKIAFSLIGNSAIFWADTGSGWTVISNQTLTVYDFQVESNLSGWMAGISVRSAQSTAWTFSSFKCGRFGGTGIRDISIVTNPDGTAYLDGTKVQFTGTASDPSGWSYSGVWTLDLEDGSIVQDAAIMISRSGSLGDMVSHIIRYQDGDRRVLSATWRTVSGGTLDIQHVLLTSSPTDDILIGTHVITGLASLTLPNVPVGGGSYDGMLAWDEENSRWLISYTITTTPGLMGAPAAAYSADLSSFTAIGYDSASGYWEGSRVLNCEGAFYFAWGGPGSDGTNSRIYDDGMNFIGGVDATFIGDTITAPWPTLFSYSDSYVILTWDSTKPTGGADWSWGQPQLLATRTPIVATSNWWPFLLKYLTES